MGEGEGNVFCVRLQWRRGLVNDRQASVSGLDER